MDFFTRSLMILWDRVETPEDVRQRLKKAEEENTNGFRILREYKQRAVGQRRDLARKEAKKLAQSKPGISPTPDF